MNLDYSSIKEDNYQIDGKKLEVNINPSPAQIVMARNANKIIVNSITNGLYVNANKDERNIVRFKIDPAFALTSGSHNIQIANIRDYAGDVDPVQNTIETDTFDFDVTADTSKPVATVVVQSPEQWFVSYNMPITKVGSKTAEDTFKIKTNNEDDSELVYDTDFTVYAVDEDQIVGSRLNAANPVSGQYFLIEFLKDWTEIYDTKTNTSKTYYASTQNP